MSLWEVVAIYVVVPAVVYFVIFLTIIVRGRARKSARYRSGDQWNFEPLFWTANPAGTGLPPGRTDDPTAASGRGGARGSW